MRKLLKSLGIALLALPEPFTIPLGVLLLCAAYSLPRRPRADSYSRLQEFGKLYLSLYRNQTWSFDTGGQFGTPEKIVHHTLRYDWHSQPITSAIPEKVIHHTLRYDWHIQPLTPEKIIHHTLNRRLATQYSGIVGVFASVR